MQELKIQTVVGLIKSAPVVIKSHKYSEVGARHPRVRSTGIYAEKTNAGIVVGYWNAATYRTDEATSQMAQFVEFATEKGYKLTQKSAWTYEIEVA